MRAIENSFVSSPILFTPPTRQYNTRQDSLVLTMSVVVWKWTRHYSQRDFFVRQRPLALYKLDYYYYHRRHHHLVYRHHGSSVGRQGVSCQLTNPPATYSVIRSAHPSTAVAIDNRPALVVRRVESFHELLRSFIAQHWHHRSCQVRHLLHIKQLQLTLTYCINIDIIRLIWTVVTVKKTIAWM